LKIMDFPAEFQRAQPTMEALDALFENLEENEGLHHSLLVMLCIGGFLNSPLGPRDEPVAGIRIDGWKSLGQLRSNDQRTNLLHHVYRMHKNFWPADRQWHKELKVTTNLSKKLSFSELGEIVSNCQSMLDDAKDSVNPNSAMFVETDGEDDPYPAYAKAFIDAWEPHMMGFTKAFKNLGPRIDHAKWFFALQSKQTWEDLLQELSSYCMAYGLVFDYYAAIEQLERKREEYKKKKAEEQEAKASKHAEAEESAPMQRTETVLGRVMNKLSRGGARRWVELDRNLMVRKLGLRWKKKACEGKNLSSNVVVEEKVGDT